MSYMLTCRRKVRDAFVAEPQIGDVSHLSIPNDVDEPTTEHEVADHAAWFRAVLETTREKHRASATATPAEEDGHDASQGDILVFVHGYNNSMQVALARQRLLEGHLHRHGWHGTVIGFDWPSSSIALGYAEDRMDAKATANLLVTRLLKPFLALRKDDCLINISVIAHSMGAFVVREAFLGSRDYRTLRGDPWMVGQIVLVGADIASSSLDAGTDATKAFDEHCARLTNYYSPYDHVLKVSNAKRAGLYPRSGRVGLPKTSISKFVDVDTGPRYATLDNGWWRAIGGIGSLAHSWYFHDRGFCRDLALTLIGDIDRNSFPTRRAIEDNDLQLNAEL